MEYWYALFSKPRQEFQVREQFAQKGLHAYIPMLPASPRDRGAPGRPLFPRYLFARLDLGRVSPDVLRWTPGLVGFVSFGGEFATVDDGIILHMQQRLEEMRRQKAVPFQPGQRVRVRNDALLSELDAVFEQPLSDGRRARILVNLLGRLTRCEIAINCLEAVSL